MRIIYGRLPYELRLVELEPWEAVAARRLPDRRRAGAITARVLPRLRPRRGRSARGNSTRVRPSASASRPVPDFGRLQRGETVGGVRPEQVMGPAREGRKIVISGDTAPCETLAVAAHRADVLVHEATFAEEEIERARRDLPQHRAPGRRARARGRGAAAGAHPRLEPLRRRRDARAGAGRVRRHGGAPRLRHDRGAVPRARPRAARALVRAPSARARGGRGVPRRRAEPIASP